MAHCADVAACCERLLQTTILRQRLARWGSQDDLDETQVSRLAVLAAFHDLGKFNYGFQNKAIPRPAYTHGHVAEILALFGDAYEQWQQRLLEVIPIQALQEWAPSDGALQLLVASIGHHGRPGTISATRLHPAAWVKGPLGDPFEGIAALHEATRRWFPLAYEVGGTPLPSTASFQHGFAGLVMLADWLGSDTSFFPYSEPVEDDRMPLAREHAAEAARAIGLDVNGPRHALGPAPPRFSSISSFDPRPAQRAMLDVPIDPAGSLTILEAETGSGKTEAALVRFLRMFHAGVVDGLYFALPTRAAATQLHRRVFDAVELAFPAGARPPVVLAVPGYLRVDASDGQRLPGFEVLWNDDDAAAQRHRGWAAEHPKRYLASAIAVGTIDQVLLSTLMVAHAHMRATCAARHLLVIDEVHASDAYMSRLLEDVLEFHVKGGGHALLMSATLGSAARSRLMASVGATVTSPELRDAVLDPYPQISYAVRGRSPVVQPVQHVGFDKVVTPEVRPIAGDPDALALAALDGARAGACVLIIRNLVRDCIATQQALEALAEARGERHLLCGVGKVVAPHHSRYARQDRKLLDAAVEALLGKGRPRDVGRVLVATQTVEQSLDIDADLLLTDLCPMDVLLQRIGRLHRHDRHRPSGYETARIGVLVPVERSLEGAIAPDGSGRGSHGCGTVYQDLRVLEATLRVCEREEAFEIPRDNRALVESTTHPAALKAIADELGEPWQRHGMHVRGGSLTDRRIASSHRIPRSLVFDGERMRFPSAEEIGKVTTRLGEDDRLVCFDRPVEGPFGVSIEALTLPHHLVRGSPDDPLAPVAVQDEGGFVRFQ